MADDGRLLEHGAGDGLVGQEGCRHRRVVREQLASRLRRCSPGSGTGTAAASRWVQIQRVWRGERPQEGRYREFTQCDIDVINLDHVPLYFDAEIPRIVAEILGDLKLPSWSLKINNRKVLQGFYENLGLADPVAVIQTTDRLDKVGREGVADILRGRLSLTEHQIGAVLDLATVSGSDSALVEDVKSMGVKSDLLNEGLTDLSFVLDSLTDLPSGSVVADLSSARGLDYYTGTVYEAKFEDWPGYGSICSGGRYENLAGSYIRKNLPGIGMSIGLTRIFAKLLSEGLLQTGPSCPTEILVLVPDPESRSEASKVTAALRSRGLNTEMHYQPDKVAKQIRYATRKGIPYAWFPRSELTADNEIKDLASGHQTKADPTSWLPKKS